MHNIRTLLVVTALMLGACAMMQGSNLTGDWQVSMDTPMGAQSFPMTLVQTGSDLTGTTSDPFGNSVDVTGTVSGDAVSFSYAVNGPAGRINISYVGTLAGNQIQGKATFGSFGEGDFTATKQ